MILSSAASFFSSSSIIDDDEKKQEALDKIIKKYGSMSKMFIRGSNENRAIIKIQEKE